MNDAGAHFHLNVVQWLETNKIEYIPARHWRATPQICPQWITELMEFLKIYVSVELQRLKANWSKWRRKCGPKLYAISSFKLRIQNKYLVFARNAI